MADVTKDENEKETSLTCTELESENRPLEDVSGMSITLSDIQNGTEEDTESAVDYCCPKQEGESNDINDYRVCQDHPVFGCESEGTSGCEVCRNCNESGNCSCPKVECVSTLVEETRKTEENWNKIENPNEDLSQDSTTVPFSNDGVTTEDVAGGFGNYLLISAEHGLMPTTCLNLEPDTPWDVLNNVFRDGTCVPFSNGGVSMKDFSTSDIIIENPAVELGPTCTENDGATCQHRENTDSKMYELSLEMLGCQSTGQCKCCTTSRDRNDSLGCSCRRSTRIVINKNCDKSSVFVLHGEKDSQNQDHAFNGDQDDTSEIYANTLFIDMDEVGVLNEEHGPFFLPHDKTMDSTDNKQEDNTDQPEVDEVQEVTDPEVNVCKHHTVYVCDEEDLQDVCRICHCGSEEEPLISPCLCTGSMQYIHHKCLMTWLQRTVRQSCELCQQEIPIVRKRKPITQWKLPTSRPTCFLWLFAFIVTLTLNIASITRDASQQCTTNACIVFYIVEAVGAILGFMFSCFFTVRCVRFIKLWMIHNEEWTFDSLTSIDNTKIVKPQKPTKKRPNIQI